MTGHRSANRPRSVSTALNGEPDCALWSAGEDGLAITIGSVLIFGAVPSERAVITS